MRQSEKDRRSYSIRQRLEDIQDNINLVQRATKGKSYEDLLNDMILRMAIERAMEIISEASKHLPPELKATRPEIPWRNVRDLGNVMRHEYQRIAPGIIWDVVINHMPPLKKAVKVLLTQQKE